MAIYETQLEEFPLLYRGKVRDVYDLGSELLVVATDRISAFDVIMPTPVPKKGFVLTQLTEFWLDQLDGIVKNHRTQKNVSDVLKSQEQIDLLDGQAVVVKKADPFPVECVARGYLLGSGYKDYKATGEVCGVQLPDNLKLAEKLPEPIFTPAGKAEKGHHDENITFQKVKDIVGVEVANQMRDTTLKLYTRAAKVAETKGILIADTKFEFGLVDGEFTLIDEVLTPDSSRFWSQADYKVGTSPVSFDKQIVRDYLETLDWNKTAPGPELPQEIVQKASARYQEVLKILTS